MYAVLIVVLLWVSTIHCYKFEEFEPIEGIDTWEAAEHNSFALLKATYAANASPVDKVITFDRDKVYYMRNVTIENITSVKFSIDATLRFSNDIKKYNFSGGSGNASLIMFVNTRSVTMEGSGTIDGQGLEWWRMSYSGKDVCLICQVIAIRLLTTIIYTGVDNRPNLVQFLYAVDVVISGLHFIDSPRFSIYFKDARDIVVRDATIFVNSSIVRAWNPDSKMYPLNTDGIDISAVNVTVYNTAITNYDDAIVVKPCRHNWVHCRCAGDVLAYNNSITYSTGLTVGTVPPHPDRNCVRNVTFRDSQLHFPLKAIYIKTNPGSNGSGVIEDIRYENLRIHGALWWTIWIGPQQQNQPGENTTSTGCNFLFPYVPQCPTQPRVSLKHITLRNITAVNTLPLFQSPGVILCNRTNACDHFLFEDVVNTPYTGNIADLTAQLPFAWPPPWLDLAAAGDLSPYLPQTSRTSLRREPAWAFEYITDFVYGDVKGRVSPEICLEDGCFWPEKGPRR
jgi:hypothetical protein